MMTNLIRICNKCFFSHFPSSLPYILGSSSSIIVAYDIENSGETAYLAKIRITIPDSRVLFTVTPSNCKLNETSSNGVRLNVTMECDLNGRAPMFNGDKTSMNISIDTTQLDGNKLIVKANVSSIGDERSYLDNAVVDVIDLQKFSNLEVIG